MDPRSEYDQRTRSLRWSMISPNGVIRTPPAHLRSDTITSDWV